MEAVSKKVEQTRQIDQFEMLGSTLEDHHRVSWSGEHWQILYLEGSTGDEIVARAAIVLMK